MVKAIVAPLEVAVGKNNPMMTGNHRSTPNHRPFGKCHAAGGQRTGGGPRRRP